MILKSNSARLRGAVPALQSLETRFTPTGPVPVGPEFQVNAYTLGAQFRPAAAMNVLGAFVITWTDFSGEAGSQRGVFAQRFAPDGKPLGAEIQVNTTTTGDQSYPAVAMDADVDFVIAWTDYSGQGGSDKDVIARRYNAVGLLQSGEFFANTYTTGIQAGAKAAMDAAWNFVVAWRDEGQVFGQLYFQRFDAMGLPVGSEIHVNTVGQVDCARIAMAANGEFILP